MTIYESRRNADGSLTVAMPIPDRRISPNARRGESKWAAIAKSKEVKRHRMAAMNALSVAITSHNLRGQKWRGYGLSFFFKTSAFRDDDNADASCKAYRDGFAQALGIDDRSLKKIRLSEQAKDKDFPRVEITLYPETGNLDTSIHANVATGLVP